MNHLECSSNCIKKPDENRDFHTIKYEEDSVTERHFISNPSINNFPDYASGILKVESDDMKITIDEIKILPERWSFGNSRVEMNVDGNDIKIQKTEAILRQTVKKERFEVEFEEMENTIGGVAKLKCERDIKIEAVDVKEENQGIAETEGDKVEVKSQIEVFDDFKVDIVDNLLIHDFVKDEIKEGMCFTTKNIFAINSLKE